MPQSLNEWVKRVEVDAGVREGVTTSEAQRVNELEREIKELRRANEILKLPSAFFAQAELDRRLKSCRISSTNIAMRTGSSQSASSCRSPRQRIGAMPPWCVNLTSVAQGLAEMMPWSLRFNV